MPEKSWRTKKAEADQKLADAKKEIDDAKNKLKDGKTELADKEKELNDGKKRGGRERVGTCRCTAADHRRTHTASECGKSAGGKKRVNFRSRRHLQKNRFSQEKKELANGLKSLQKNQKTFAQQKAAF